MSEEKFTPGEWEIEEKEMGCGTLFRYGFQVVCWEKRRRIAYMETCSLGDKEEMQANANLISAAPVMYALLQMIADPATFMGAQTCEELRTAIEAILKKARGEA